MSVLWGLGQQQPGSDFGSRYQQSYDAGIQRADQQALRGFQQEDRDLRQQQAKQQQGQQITERQREEIRIGARIVRQINPQDEASWQRARALAQQAGVDLTDVPATFDPAYRDQLLAAGHALEDQQAPYTLGEGDVRYDANNQVIGRGGPPRPRYIPVPPGGRLVLDPSSTPPERAQQQPQTATNPQTGERVQLNPQTGQWEPVQGGAGPQAPRPFP